MNDNFTFDNFDDIGSQGSLGTLDVYADIVYCLDLTSSMKPIIDKVKETALTLHDKLQHVMSTNYQRSIKQLRIKVIGFRDAYCDASKAFEISRFFYLPEEAAEFKSFVDGLEPKGGGDIPENALEALALAIKSDWCKTIDNSIRKRHIVIMFTDAPAHPLEKSKDGTDSYYPEGMPAEYVDLVDWWCSQGKLASGTCVEMDPIAKRIAVYAPESCEPWTDIADDFDNAYTCYIKPDNGGADISTEGLIKMLSETMA